MFQDFKICPRCLKPIPLTDSDREQPPKLPAAPSLAPATGSASECCADWTPGITKLNGPIVLQSIRAGKDLYTGKPFLFCPWCGQKRPNEKS